MKEGKNLRPRKGEKMEIKLHCNCIIIHIIEFIENDQYDILLNKL